MRKKFNLVGNTFTHLTDGNKGYSVHGKESKYIEWVKDGTGEATFYIDSTLGHAFIGEDDGKPKYAWLLESKYITPQIVDSVRMFPEKYLEMFDIIFTHNQELLKIDSKFKWCPAQGFWIKEPKIYEKSKITRVQTQWSGTESDIHVVFYEKFSFNPEKLTVRYEIELKLKQEGRWRLEEWTVDSNGKIISQVIVVTPRTDHLEY